MQHSKKLRPIMFVGTGSDVGKSVINTAFCRLFLQDGYSPAPFKAQNMSLNSYATKEQLEIGRAQAVQAEACGIDCHVDMNPILLKPTSHSVSQVVLLGKPSGNKSAHEYFNDPNRQELFGEVMQAYTRLASQYNPIVIEGAGSISEVNLWSKDIVNMRVALGTGAATFLVADIDRGGVFASVYGSIQLLPPAERAAIKGIIINKFRGDISLFTEGKKILQELTAIPVVGVIPYLDGLFIEEEDSVIVDTKQTHGAEKDINVAVVRLKYMSNFTDFKVIEQIPQVHLYYSDDPCELLRADIIIIPGSKNTIGDLQVLREKGLDTILLAHHLAHKPLIGICGGYQIMGEEILDPYHIEGAEEIALGLGILPISTTLTQEKETRQCQFEVLHTKAQGSGYEIHMGITPTERPFALINGTEKDGYLLNEYTWGTYLHGILDNSSIIENLLQLVRSDFKVTIDYKAQKEEAYDKLANMLRQHCDLEYIYNSLLIE